jgi:5S rRNA maturation endonuclease (ribonuclease M5)
MFKTKNLVHDIKDVPIPWIFEHFCKLEQKLSGEDVKIKSMFNAKERTPSMCIYFDPKKDNYRYKDFSSGKGGSAIDLVKELMQLSYHKACALVVECFNDYVLHNNGGYDVQEFKQASKYKVSQYVFRSWNTSDQYYWTQFNIGSKLLDEYCVKPLESYTLEKDCDGTPFTLTITGNYLYGYFKKDGTLYKIYQPKTQDKKFIKVTDYIQGSEQLKGNKYLIITSSLKDIMALRSLRLAVDVIAPDSENSMIRKEQMQQYLKDYQKVIVMFDYDEPGIKAAEKYKELYPKLALCILPMSKDPSDSLKDHGAKKVYYTLVPLLNKKLDNT